MYLYYHNTIFIYISIYPSIHPSNHPTIQPSYHSFVYLFTYTHLLFYHISITVWILQVITHWLCLDGAVVAPKALPCALRPRSHRTGASVTW